MRMKKLGTAIAAGAAVAIAAGCSSGSGTAQSGKPTVTVWTWAQNSSMAAAAYAKAHPNVKVEISNVGSGGTEYTKLSTALAAGSGAPCIAQVEYDHLPAFEAKPGLLDLSQYGANKYKGDYPSWVWDLVSKSSTVYGIPQDIGPVGYAYRPDIFSKYHLTVPKTWAEFATDAVTLHKDNPKMYLTYYATDDSELNGLTSQAGGQMFSQHGNAWTVQLSNPASQKVMAMWGKLIKEGAIPVENLGTPASGKAISSGEFASYVEAAWDPTYLGSFMVGSSVKQSMIMTQLPQWTASGTPASFDWGGSSYAMTNQCPAADRAAAVAFAGWLFTSQPGLSVSQGNGNLKPGTSGAGMGLFDAATNRASVASFNQHPAEFTAQSNVFNLFNTYSAQVPTGFVWSPFENYVSDVWPTLLTSATSGKITFSQALNQLQSQVVTYAKQQGYSVTG
jgi:multiple sugar transport system substrate-binding protein